MDEEVINTINECALISGAFFSICLIYFVRNRYDLNILYKSQYLMFQELLLIAIRLESKSLQFLPLSDLQIKAISCIYILADSTYFITFILLIYRTHLLNEIEFGRLPSNKYAKYMSRLKDKWNIIISIVFTLLIGIPIVILYLIGSDYKEPYSYFAGNIVFENKKDMVSIFFIGFTYLIFLQFVVYSYLVFKTI